MHLIRFNHYSKAVDLSHQFLSNTKLEPIMESDSDNTKSVISEIIDKYKLNLTIVLSFGTGMELIIPIIKKLCENGEFNIDLNIETVTLMAITAITIVYLEEAKEEKLRREAEKHKIVLDEEQIESENRLIKSLEKDSKSLLEELKLRGVGNGIVKKIIICVKSIGKLAKLLFRHSKSVIESFFDMFGYAAICIPVLTSIKLLITNYNWTLDNFYNNLESILIGLGSLSAKHLANWFLGLTKDKKVPAEIRNSGKIVDVKYKGEHGEKLIKEQ